LLVCGAPISTYFGAAGAPPIIRQPVSRKARRASQYIRTLMTGVSKIV